MQTQVKICGLTSEADVDTVRDEGASFAGFVHFAKSPRHVVIEDAARLVAHTREGGGPKSVLLLVNPDDTLADAAARDVRPDYLQLHGTETPERVMEIRERTGLRIIKAVAVTSGDQVLAARTYLGDGGADILLFDAKPPTRPDALPGGNGLSFDWRILDVLAGKTPFALAGGLTPENVREAAQRTQATILDVSSGVEKAPGEKDPVRIRRFLQEVKAANEAMS